MTLSRLGICAGMVSGMSLAVEALTAALCLPDLITVEEQVRVVVEFLKALRSDQLQEPTLWWQCSPNDAVKIALFGPSSNGLVCDVLRVLRLLFRRLPLKTTPFSRLDISSHINKMRVIAGGPRPPGTTFEPVPENALKTVRPASHINNKTRVIAAVDEEPLDAPEGEVDELTA